MGWKELKGRFQNATSVAKTMESSARALRREAPEVDGRWHSSRIPYLSLFLRTPCKGKIGDVRFGDVEVLWDPTEQIDADASSPDRSLGILRFEAWKAQSPSSRSHIMVVEAACVRMLMQRIDDMKASMKLAVMAGATDDDLKRAMDELSVEAVMEA